MTCRFRVDFALISVLDLVRQWAREDVESVLWSFVYACVVRLVELVVWMFRSRDAKEVEILVLRHESCAAKCIDPHCGPLIGRSSRR